MATFTNPNPTQDINITVAMPSHYPIPINLNFNMNFTVDDGNSGGNGGQPDGEAAHSKLRVSVTTSSPNSSQIPPAASQGSVTSSRTTSQPALPLPQSQHLSSPTPSLFTPSITAHPSVPSPHEPEHKLCDASCPRCRDEEAKHRHRHRNGLKHLCPASCWRCTIEKSKELRAIHERGGPCAQDCFCCQGEKGEESTSQWSEAPLPRVLLGVPEREK
ncbi:hypothetical protein B0H66DRAFT_538667 [Apodospora peruviana]|uniref:Uncharacterized protein n=1 Tax=Apodospora peruviana TaxID=516989 RepID=A0AAE0LYB2_9PEZI|nr:hypothetical protein B0H66DRAFT_538667 [Apodospora peruviana]